MKDKIIVIGVALHPPRNPTPQTNDAFDRLRAAERRLLELSDDLVLDAGHLVDIADAAELLVSIYRRARACRRGADGLGVTL